MIEQTELLVTSWHVYPLGEDITYENISNITTLDVMRKTAPTKKGLACRLTCHFINGDYPILDYVAEHSYVIDLDEVIDKKELMNMIRNSFAQFEEKFEFRKLGTVLHNQQLTPMDETLMDLDPIIPLLV